MIYNNDYINGYSAPEIVEQNNNSAGCTSCRQKIAQQTFDMVVGGTSYGPLHDIMTQYQVPTIAVGGELTVPKSPAEYEVNVIDMLYGSRLPNYQQINSIDTFYGKKDEAQTIKETCNRRNKYGKFGYEDIEIKNYIKSSFVNEDCTIFLFFETYNYHSEWGYSHVSVPIIVDISDCCEEFNKKLYCASNDKELYYSFNIFGRCVKKLITNKIKDMQKSHPYYFDIITPPYTIPLKPPLQQLKEKMKVLFQDIANSRNDFLKSTDFNKWAKSGYNTDNKLSCLCKEDGEPVYCCEPEYDKINCFCENGKLRNLCGEADTYVDLYLPYQFNINFRYNQPSPKVIDCFGYVSDMYYKNSISCEVFISKTGKKIENIDNVIVSNLPYYGYPNPGDIPRYRILRIKVSTCDLCDIKLTFRIECGECYCPPDKQRIIEYIIKDFNYYKYSNQFPNEIPKYYDIEFQKYIDGYVKSEESLNDCVICKG